MKIAVACQDDKVSEHFGFCQGFMVFEKQGSEMTCSFIDNPGHQPGLLPKVLADHGVTAVIAGGMGERAQGMFASMGINVIVGAQGSCQEIAQKYQAGELESSGQICRDHQHAGSCQQE